MSSSESEQQSSCSEGMSQKQKRGAPWKYKSDEIILWKVFMHVKCVLCISEMTAFCDIRQAQRRS